MAEVAEQVVRIVGAGCGFRVILHAEERQAFVTQAFEGLVIEVDVGKLDVVGVDGVGIDGEVVVVRSDFDLARLVVAHGMIAAVVSELELVRAAAEGETTELVAEADAEDGHAPDHVANGLDRIIDGLGIAGAVGEKDTVGLESENVGGGGLRRDDGDFAAFAREHAEDVLLDAEVVGDHTEMLPRFCALVECGRQKRIAGLVAAVARVEFVDGFCGDNFGEVGTVHLADIPGFLDECIGIGNVGGDDSAHDAVGSQMANQGAGVDLGEHGNGIALHVLVGDLFGAPVGADRGEFAHDQALDVGLRGFVVGVVGSVVADLGICENDDLTGIGRIGSDFLITGKRSIEDYFTLAFAGVAMTLAEEDAPVFERKNCLHCRSEEWIQ